MKFIAGLLAGAVLVAAVGILVTQAQTAPSESWRYDMDGNGAVTISDAVVVVGHIGETYPLPGPCHAFVPFATPVVLSDGTYMDGYFADDLSAPPSRDYLTC